MMVFVEQIEEERAACRNYEPETILKNLNSHDIEMIKTIRFSHNQIQLEGLPILRYL